ncbi:hypothetical protein ABL78_6413 [Leptomonas seymouri]|uniref:F-box domain-containing protein n=1 Tax=Leptomonas seymouri TaxID=5684 RepID=A0A0N1IIW6_LEPSE|nr:hypothetical protein ABL78_6413 [Leptomonas seymouri]|eukprot:KPI84528.1 hypothetical protein ABL78_6413 [Leptomonas seymouri]
MRPTPRTPAPAALSFSHLLSPEAVDLLRDLHFPLPAQHTASTAPLRADTLSLLDLVLHLNDVYALSFWVLRSFAAKLKGSLKASDEHPCAVSPAPASAGPRELLACCEAIQHAREALDRRLGRLVLGPVLLSCLFFYVDAMAYDTAALQRDVWVLLAPGGGPPRYCVDDEEDETSPESGSNDGALGEDSSCSSNDESDLLLAADEVTLQSVDPCYSMNGQATGHHVVSAATRRRWQRERARVVSMPPPQSDVAALLVSIAKALHESSTAAGPPVIKTTKASTPSLVKALADSIAMPSQADVPQRLPYAPPWTLPSASEHAHAVCTGRCSLLHHTRVVSALLRRASLCLTNPFTPSPCAAAVLRCRPSHGNPLVSSRTGGHSLLPASSLHRDVHDVSIHAGRRPPSPYRSRMAYAAYCEGLRRRRGGNRVDDAEEPDGVVLQPIRRPPPLTGFRIASGEGAAPTEGRRVPTGASPSLKVRNRLLMDPFASPLPRPPFPPLPASLRPVPAHAEISQGHLQDRNADIDGRAPSCSMNGASSALPEAALPKKKRDRVVSHWSDVHSPWPCSGPPNKIQRVRARCGEAVGEPSPSSQTPPPTPTPPRDLTHRLPVELQRLCLEYVSPRQMRTVSTVCVMWYRLVRGAPASSSALASAFHISTAVTRAYKLFFQLQWGEQALPVTLLTSLHRLRILQLMDRSSAALVQANWSCVRWDADVCAYVRQRFQLSPLRHLTDGLEESSDDTLQAFHGDVKLEAASASFSSTAVHAGSRQKAKLKPLSAVHYVFYILWLIPTTPSLQLPPASPASGESSCVRTALRRLLHAWATELKWAEFWSTTTAAAAPPTSSSAATPCISSLLTNEAIRQQKLVWWLLTNSASPAPSAATAQGTPQRLTRPTMAGAEADEDFVMQLWSNWPSVHEVYRRGEAYLDHGEGLSRERKEGRGNGN